MHDKSRFSCAYHKNALYLQNINYNNRHHLMNILKDIFLRFPAIPVAVSVVAGILVGDRFQYVEIWITIAAVLTLASMALQKNSKLASTTILAGFFSIGAFLSGIQQKEMNVTLPEGEISYKAVVINEAREHPKTWSADIEITSGIMKGKVVKAYFLKEEGRIPIPTARFNATSVLTLPQNIRNNQFDYAVYLRRHGISATTLIAPWKYEQKGFGTDGLSKIRASTAILCLMRLELMQEISKWGLREDTESLIAGVALGQRHAIKNEIRETYSQAGASHILALSGLHLGIIWSIFNIFCIGRLRTLGTMLSLFTIWAYTLFVGLPPSAVRAAIMLTIYSLANLTNRQGASLNALAFSAIIILIINPVAIYDLGMQLSFSAVAFIIIFVPPFTNIVSQKWRLRHRIINKLWQLCVLSIVANIGTLPLVVYNFSRVPIYVIATNLLAIPLITILLWLFALCMLLMIVGAPDIIFKSAIWLLDNTASVLNKSMELVASLPFSSIGDIHISAMQTVLLYCIFLCISFSLLKSCHNGE